MYLAWAYYMYSGTLFLCTSPTGDGTAILHVHCHPNHANVYLLAVQRKYLHFSVILRPWVLVQSQDFEPATSCFAVTCYTNWANTVAVKIWTTFSNLNVTGLTPVGSIPVHFSSETPLSFLIRLKTENKNILVMYSPDLPIRFLSLHIVPAVGRMLVTWT